MQNDGENIISVDDLLSKLTKENQYLRSQFIRDCKLEGENQELLEKIELFREIIKGHDNNLDCLSDNLLYLEKENKALQRKLDIIIPYCCLSILIGFAMLYFTFIRNT